MYLGADLEHVLEADARVGEFALEHHDDVVVVLADLLATLASGMIERVLSELLQLEDLLVECGDVLLDDVGELLSKPVRVSAVRLAHTPVEGVREGQVS